MTADAVEPTVPEEAIEAAAKVLRCDYATQYDDTNVGWQEFTDPARDALAAAAPVIEKQHEKQLRARLADEIEATIAGERDWNDATPVMVERRSALRLAARIVRGEQP